MNDVSIACNLSALDSGQRQRREQLFGALRGRAERFDETGRGYRLQFPAGSGVWMTAAELISLERRCCPFLRFQLSVDEGGRVAMLLGGGEGAKEFLASELGLSLSAATVPARRRAIAALLAPVAAAATALFCCVGPLLLAAAGVASAGLGIALARYRLLFAAAAIVLAATGFLALYRPGRRRPPVRPAATPSFTMRVLFWVGVGVSLAAVAATFVV